MVKAGMMVSENKARTIIIGMVTAIFLFSLHYNSEDQIRLCLGFATLTVRFLAYVWPWHTAVLVIPLPLPRTDLHTIFLARPIVGFFPRVICINYWGAVTPLVAGFCSKVIKSNP